LPHQCRGRPDRRRSRHAGGAARQEDRRRRPRRVRRRAVAQGPSAAQDGQRRTDAASRLRGAQELPELFRRRGRGHPRLHRWQAGTGHDELIKVRGATEGLMYRPALSVLAILALSGAPPCQAQSQAGLPLLVLEIRPAVLAPAAFTRPYGRLLAAEFGEVVRDSANADCLKTKGIQRTALAKRTIPILLRQARQMFELLDGTIDRAAFDARLRELAGPNVEAEWARVRNDPDVKAFLTLYSSLRLAVTAAVAI